MLDQPGSTRARLRAQQTVAWRLGDLAALAAPGSTFFAEVETTDGADLPMFVKD